MLPHQSHPVLVRLYVSGEKASSIHIIAFTTKRTYVKSDLVTLTTIGDELIPAL